MNRRWCVFGIAATLGACGHPITHTSLLPGTWLFPRASNWRQPTDTIARPTDSALVTPDVVYEVSVLVEKPERLSGPAPVYPRAAQLDHIEGTVMLNCIIDTLGRVDPQSVQLVDSADTDLAASAVSVLLQSRYKPGRVAGRAVYTLVKIPVTYLMRRS